MNMTDLEVPDINRLTINEYNEHNEYNENNGHNEHNEHNEYNEQSIPERSIDYLLQNPEYMLNSMSLVQQHTQGQIDNLDANFVNLSVNSNSDGNNIVNNNGNNTNINSTTDMEQAELENDDDVDENRRNPLYNKIVPLEVANYYCKEYFDDEDFIYMRFELPNDLIEEIMESGNKSITEYFDTFLNNIEITEDDTTELSYFNLYNSCVKVYDIILEHYMPQWYDYDGPIDENNKYAKFNGEWTQNCRLMLDIINDVLTMGMSDKSMEYLCNYNKEIYTGLFIIMTRLKDIFLYFNDKSSVSEFIDYNKDYRNITIRLVNNICVILLYLKFYYLNNPEDGKENDNLYSDKMITTEED
jgi:hypothetical protein